MTRTASDIDADRAWFFARLAQREQELCSAEKIRFVCHAFILWFVGVLCWHLWPYFLNPTMWPKTMYVLWCVGHVVVYVTAVLGALMAAACLFTGGKLFDSDWDE